ncbi:hypothetical protein [Thalassotalea atypica]|uniref:hypothetical protein n=1 Tax=Thalassotalea atypica TaxID=2054316 RepID=UPI002572A501|nr:hypothetical protein [Thalassotalea atypica]
MEKHRLSFAKINILNDRIAEVVFDKGVNVSIEMMENIETFVCDKFDQDFGVLVNKLFPFSYTLEAKLNLGSMEKMKAIASVNYNENSSAITQSIIDIRATDQLNIKSFNGLDLGWQEAHDWLIQQLT